jgi:raffinose/stachyose/melibiose transport system permease protein
MKRYTWKTGILEAAMIIAAIFFLVPVYILVNLAVRTAADPSSPMIPTVKLTFDNFVQAWVVGGLANGMFNSLLITTVSVVLITVLAALASFPLARVSSGWSRGVYFFLMIGLLIPFQLVFIPLYQTFHALGLLGGPWGLVILYVGHQMPFAIFLYASFLRELPLDYEDASSLDGASRVQTFRYVLFPMLAPVTGTVAILSVILVWNDFMTPLLYLSGSPNQTVPVAIYGFVGEYVSNWPVIFAGLIIGMLPVLVAYLILQRRILDGFAVGVKG